MCGLQSAEVLPLTVHLDNWKLITSDVITYDPVTKTSSFRLPLGYFSSKEIIVWALEGDEYQGTIAYPTISSSIDSSSGMSQFTATLQGDYSSTRLLVGYQFKYSVSLPKLNQPQSQQ